jgi:hypothetical protein
MKRTLSLSTIALLLTACALSGAPAQGPAQPNPHPYILVTAGSAPTATAFQPPAITPLPSWTPGPSATATASPTTSATPSPSATPSQPPTFTPVASATPIPPARPQYNLNALWDYDGRTVIVSQEILYPNNTGQALGEMLLAVNPNLWNGVFSLLSLTVNGQDSAAHMLSGQRLTVPLTTPLQPGEILLLGIGYQLNLPYSSSKYENFGYTSRQTNLTDWFPFVPPYFPGEGWVLREPWGYGENLVYPLADFNVGVTFSDPASTPIVAASAPAWQEGNSLRYAFPQARTFSLSASRDFLVSTAEENGVSIASYYFAEHAAAGEMLLYSTQAAVRTYSQSFGPYAHNWLAAVETDLNDGLESDGLYFLASSFYASYDGTAANNLVMIGIHETAHQWWFGAVASDQALEPWIDEALCTYSEHVFYENNYPGLLNWWWNARINYYNPTGYVDMRIYNATSFRQYVNAVYLRGALFFDDLRARMGDEAFFAFLRDYYARHRGYIATAETFFTVLDAHSSNYNDIVEAYFYNR